MTSSWIVKRLAALWLAAALLCTLLAHGLCAEGMPIEAATAGVWLTLIGLGALLPSPVDVLGIDQAAVTAGDFEWQQEHVTPVATVLTVASAIFVVPAAMTLLGIRRPWLPPATDRIADLPESRPAA